MKHIITRTTSAIILAVPLLIAGCAAPTTGEYA